MTRPSTSSSSCSIMRSPVPVERELALEPRGLLDDPHHRLALPLGRVRVVGLDGVAGVDEVAEDAADDAELADDPVEHLLPRVVLVDAEDRLAVGVEHVVAGAPQRAAAPARQRADLAAQAVLDLVGRVEVQDAVGGDGVKRGLLGLVAVHRHGLLKLERLLVDVEHRGARRVGHADLGRDGDELERQREGVLHGSVGRWVGGSVGRWVGGSVGRQNAPNPALVTQQIS